MRVSPVDDAAILHAIDDAIDAGDVCINGQPSARDIRQHLPPSKRLTPRRISDRLSDLEDQGEVECSRTTRINGHGDVKTAVRVDGSEVGDAPAWDRHSLRNRGGQA